MGAHSKTPTAADITRGTAITYRPPGTSIYHPGPLTAYTLGVVHEPHQTLFIGRAFGPRGGPFEIREALPIDQRVSLYRPLWVTGAASLMVHVGDPHTPGSTLCRSRWTTAIDPEDISGRAGCHRCGARMTRYAHQRAERALDGFVYLVPLRTPTQGPDTFQ